MRPAGPARAGRLLLGSLAAVVLLGCLAVTLSRASSSGWGPAVQAASFAPLALPAHAVLALAALGLAGRRRDRPHRRRTVPAAVAAAVLLGLTGLHLAWLAPQVVGGPAAVDDDAPRLRVLALNVLGGAADPAAVVAQAAAVDADVLVLSEVTPDALARLVEAGLAAAYPHRAGQPAEWVIGTMVFATVPLRDVERLPMGYGAWGTTLDTAWGDLRLLAVHPSPPLGDADSWARDHAVLLAEVRRGEVDLVAGDLNATPDHAPLHAYADAGLRSAAELTGAGWAPTWPAQGRVGIGPLRAPRLVQIDHVLVAPGLGVTDYSRVSVPGTDHSGVVAEVAARS